MPLLLKLSATWAIVGVLFLFLSTMAVLAEKDDLSGFFTKVLGTCVVLALGTFLLQALITIWT